MNEWYLRDLSRKQKTAIRVKGESGKPTTNCAIYGYRKDPENKYHWLIDEEAAAVVRRIFHSVVAGESIASIARALRAEKIPIPSEHWKRIGAPVRSAKYTDPYAWSTTTISYILKRPEYTGRKVLGKTVCENYKTKSTRKTAPEEQYIFDGEIPAIVDEETWNTVQRLMGTKRRAPKRQNTPNRLTGLLYCADCGAKLYFCTCSTYKDDSQNHFVCSNYKSNTGSCKIHYIREQVLYRIVLETIRQTLSYVRMFRKDFKLEMLAQDEESRKAELAEKQKALSGAKKRMEDLDRIIQHIYEDNVLGKLSDSRYLKLSRQYEKEQAEIEQLAAVLEREIETQAGQVSNVNEFLKLVDKYLDISEPDAVIPNELVSKIVVHSPVRENGRKQVRIDLYFTYVGKSASLEDWKGVLKTNRNRRDLTRRFLAKDQFFVYGTPFKVRIFLCAPFEA